MSGPRWGEIGLIFLVCLVAGGDAAPHVNEAHYLSRLKHYWDPDWCAGDFFLETPDAHFTVVWLFGWVTLFLSLEATAWLGRVLTWVLIAWAWGRLGRALSLAPGMTALSAAVMVVLTEQTHLAGEWLVGGFEAKGPAYGLVLLALSDAIRGRWSRAWAALGGASALHVLVGGWAALALAGVSLTLGAERPTLRSMAPGLAWFFVLAALGAAPALTLNRGTPPDAVAEANQVYVFTRLPHHLALLNMPEEWLNERRLRHTCIISALALLQVGWLNRQESPGLRLITRFAWFALAFSAFGFVIAWIGREDPAWAAQWLKYYWHRLADIAAPIAVALIFCSWLGGALREKMLGSAALAASLAFCLWGLGDHVVERCLDPTAPAEAKLRDAQAWNETCDWVAENTPEGSVFLVPRSSATFRWRSGRPEVVTHKDIPQNAAGLVQWRERMETVFQIGHWPSGEPRWAPSLASLGRTRLLELAERYGAHFVVSQDGVGPGGAPPPRASLPIVQRVGPYTVYDLRSVGHNQNKPQQLPAAESP